MSIRLYLTRGSTNSNHNMKKFTRLFILLAFVAPGMISSPVAAQVSITCPSDMVVPNDPDECFAEVNYVEPVFSGTGTNITLSLIAGLPSGDPFPVGVTQVTYRVTNDEGDSDECTFYVTVEDTQDPVIDCPPDIFVTAVPGTCAQVVEFDIPEVSDNCGVISMTQIGGMASGSSFPVGENFIDFQAMDANGNSAFCRVVINVEDANDPTITCPEDITVSTDTDCGVVVNYTPPVGVDMCLPSSTTQISGLGSGALFPVGVTTEVFQVIDLQGNIATCSFDVIVLDEGMPAFDSCPSDIVLNAAPGECDAVAVFPTPTATDNCPDVEVTQTAGLPSNSAFPTGTTEVEFTATDASGNTVTCSFVVTVLEDIDPEITCPADMTVSTDPGQCTAVVNYPVPEGTDNCDGATTTLISGIGSGGEFPLGTHTEVYEVTDASGNTATCSFEITVEDNEAPEFNCPGDITMPADPGECTAEVVFSAPVVTDNCGVDNVVQTGGLPSGSQFPVGTTSIEFTATDNAGNTSVCTFDVIVSDNETPTITCPDDLTVAALPGECAALVTYDPPVIDDNCPGVVWNLVDGPASGDMVPAGDHEVTLEVVDAAGNSTTCTFTVSVTESTLPTIDCPEDITVNTDPGSCEAVVHFDDATATDACSDVTVVQTAGPASGSAFPAGVTTIEFTATDEYGNETICTFDILVLDENEPEITCQDDITVENDPGLCGAVVNYDPPTATDECSAVTITLISGPASGDVFPVGVTTVTFEAADASGNTATCSFDVLVEDTEVPTISCPADIDIALPAGECAQVVNYTLPTVADNCNVASISLISGNPSGDEFQVGTTTVTFEVTDDAGNTAQCSFDVTLTESVNPEITCPDDITVGVDAGECGAVVNYTPPVGTDDCGVESTVLTSGLGTGAFFPVGVHIEEYTVTDMSGNQATCSFTITVVDDEAPVVECPGDIVVGTDPDQCDAVVEFDDPVVTDNCDDALPATMIAGLPSGSTFPLGTTVVEYEVSDLAGNTTTCSFQVVVEDQTAPEMTCPADIEISAAAGECDSEVSFPTPTATDNCGNVVVVQTAGPASGSTFPAGVTTVEFTATDDAGNETTCSFTVTVTENDPPTIACPEDVTVSTDDASCSALVEYEISVADDCGEVTLTLVDGLASGEAFPLGTTTVTYEATDESGNTTQCSFTVEVVDETAPVFDCPDDLTLSTDEGECHAVYNFTLPTAEDNCDDDPVIVQTSGPAPGSELPLGVTTFEFTATDAAGNVATCSYDVTVVDEEAPVISDCPEDMVVYLDGESCEIPVSFDAPTTSDNCSATISQVSGPASGSAMSAGLYTVEYLAEDASGNTATCSFQISVLDTIAPVITCPDPIETCSTVVYFDMPTATDACGIADVVQISGPTSGNVFPVGVTVLEFQATDNQGNTATCTLEVEVLQSASRPEVNDMDAVCNEDEITLVGNEPTFGIPHWEMIEGSGTIVHPDSIITDVINLSTGTHTFVYSIDPGNGCEILYDTLSVSVETEVFVDAGEDASIMLGGHTQLMATASMEDGDFEWAPGDGLSCLDCMDPIASPMVHTLYYVRFTSPMGCIAFDSTWVRVFRELPNTITPDGDGVNDVWNIPGIEAYPDAEVYIYNRWGVEVYAAKGYEEPWDGTHEGEELPTGSYFYIIKYNDPAAVNQEGTVNIIR